MTPDTPAIAHLRALIKDPLGHVAEASEFLARVDAGHGESCAGTEAMRAGLLTLEAQEKISRLGLLNVMDGQIEAASEARTSAIALLRAALTQEDQHGDCEMGMMCLNCQPRGPNGECPDAPKRLKEGDLHYAVHMNHCFQGEWEGGCKYGEVEICPATPKPAASKPDQA